jgi:hypothetical protein
MMKFSSLWITRVIHRLAVRLDNRVVDSVQLDLTKQQVENLPPVKTDQPIG